MSVFNKLLPGILVCAVAVCASGQYRIDSWTTDNGLPQASINSIRQTHDGYLWFTTFGGLVRYDGVRFQVFNSGNTKGLSTSRFLELYEARDGSLWISSEGQAIIRYQNGEFTTLSKGLPNCGIHIFGDITGKVLFGCNEGKSNYTLQWNGDMFVPYLSPDGAPVRNILEPTAKGAVWYVRDDRLQKFEGGKVTVDVAPAFAPRRALEDSSGRLWIVSMEGALFVLQDGKIEDYSQRVGFPKVHVGNLFEDRQGRIWFGTQESGVGLYANDKFTFFTAADGLVNNTVYSVYQDREGVVWAATIGGLSRLTERAVSAYSTKDGLAADNVYPILQDSKGTIWIGSWKGLTIFQNGTWQNVGARYGIAGQNILSFLEDQEGSLWIGTWSEGVHHLKDGQVTSYPGAGLPGFRVRAIAQDRTGSIWFGTGDGLVRFQDGKFSLLAIPAGLSGKEISALHEDRNGGLWVGTRTGLSIYQDGAFTSFAERDGFGGGTVRSIKEDTDGTIWIGMYDSGLYRVKDRKFTHITANEGLFDNGAFQIIEDGKSNFWISCNLGIYRVRRSELNDLADGRIANITSVPYNKHDGMLISECNGGGQPAGIKANDGSIWFPTQQGVAVVHPDAVPFNALPPPVVIEALTLDTKPVDLRAPVRIQPSQTYLEIQYTGLSFINPELVKFKYKMEGFDADWIDAGTRRTAYYTQLPPGQYTFRAIAANRDGVWNEVGASIEITVLPPFWRTWWFIGLMVLALTGIVFAYIRWRMGQFKRAFAAKEAFSRQLIESQEAERKRIAAELHDNLGQHLVIIKNWASLGLNFSGPEAPVREQLGEISTTAVQALNEVREIIHDLRPYQIEAIGLSNTIRYMIEQAAASSGINLKSSCDDVDGILSPEEEVTFYRMVQECVSNIIKHSRAKNASIAIKRTGRKILLLVSDDGSGFVPGEKLAGSGFGLKGLSERVRMLSGKIDIQSAPTKGTSIAIEVGAKPT